MPKLNETTKFFDVNAESRRAVKRSGVQLLMHSDWNFDTTSTISWALESVLKEDLLCTDKL